MRPTRRTQPYRAAQKGRGSAGPLGPARTAMRKGRAPALGNPMDPKRLATKMLRRRRR